VQSITVLGSTGSIGKNTLDVLLLHKDTYRVFALTANTQVALLAKQCLVCHPEFAVVSTDYHAQKLISLLKDTSCKTRVLHGKEALVEVSASSDVNTVMAAIVGAAGLMPTFAAVQAGKRVLLANKESLVMSGGLFMQAAKKSGALILPTDSEHNAIFQCLPDQVVVGGNTLTSAGVSKLLLTGSGGPFRTTAKADLKNITPEQACAHPNWSMGKKISVDSATMMNKGLEFIEACWLFHAAPCDIDILIHPQSIVHSMVQYCDGSVMAQLGQPDMRTPIAHCLAWPQRIEANVAPLDFASLKELTFEQPDFDQFVCLDLAINAIKAGNGAPVALNAANEIAVEAFLQRKIPFTAIADTIAQVLQEWDGVEPTNIDMVIEQDNIAREKARSYLSR